MENDVIDTKYEFYDGRKPPYSDEVQRGVFSGYTVILRRPNSSTHIYFDNYAEAMDTIANHVSKYDTYVELDKLEAEYCTNNAWTRSGT